MSDKLRQLKQEQQNLGKVRAPVEPSIILVTGWWNENRRSSFETSLKLIDILKPLSSRLAWIITNQHLEVPAIGDTKIIEIRSKHVEGALLKVITYYLLHQAKVTLAMFRLLIHSKIDIFIFAFGTDSLLFPVLLSRLARKKVIIRSDGRPSFSFRNYYLKRNKARLYSIIETIVYSLASRIATECKYFVKLHSLQRYSKKVSPGNLYVDTRVFSDINTLAQRTYDLGYIGRLHKEKGALELVQSLPLLTIDRDIHAIMVGDGKLRDRIEMILDRDKIQDKVTLLRWVANKEIPCYLNDMKVLVVPSYSEGLPNIILEAMACGTPVLATPVGGIPEVIKDGETGFIMEDNSPECIAENIVRALNCPALERIATNAHKIIEKDYTYESSLERYQNMLTTLMLKK
jgi:glycosyltransferase involved in cell wall biosynthesis